MLIVLIHETKVKRGEQPYYSDDAEKELSKEDFIHMVYAEHISTDDAPRPWVVFYSAQFFGDNDNVEAVSRDEEVRWPSDNPRELSKFAKALDALKAETAGRTMPYSSQCC